MFSRMASSPNDATIYPAHPFCGRNCKLADLSNWFNERYTVAAEPANPDDIPDKPVLH
jgi:endogenous inhibitor of DNA gyrase (YacG/DUF329 family)